MAAAWPLGPWARWRDEPLPVEGFFLRFAVLMGPRGSGGGSWPDVSPRQIGPRPWVVYCVNADKDGGVNHAALTLSMTPYRVHRHVIWPYFGTVHENIHGDVVRKFPRLMGDHDHPILRTKAEAVAASSFVLRSPRPHRSGVDLPGVRRNSYGHRSFLSLGRDFNRLWIEMYVVMDGFRPRIGLLLFPVLRGPGRSR